jgi:hypothetical protein
VFKKIIGVMLILAIGYGMSQWLGTPEALFSKASSLSSSADVKTELAEIENKNVAGDLGTAENIKNDAAVAAPEITSEDILLSATQNSPFGLWLGLYSHESEIEKVMTLLSDKDINISSFVFINALNESDTLLVAGPLATKPEALLLQNKLSNEHAINSSIIKFPEVKPD